MSQLNVKLMSYNIGGGRRSSDSQFDSILQIVRQQSPDILAVQEAVTLTTLDGNSINQPQQISKDGNLEYSFFGPTLDMRKDFNVQKELFIQGIFNDWKNWQQGNALFSRWPFLRLGNDNVQGQPENIPIYKTLYRGNRETDPRFVVLAKIDFGFSKAFVITTHLTTLHGERGLGEIPKKKEEAQMMRWEQCERILDLIREYVLERNELVFLLGDLNAISNEPGIANSLEKRGGFVRLIPQNNISSHLNLANPVDHIFIFPGKFHIKYICNIIDDKFTASDHNPIVANIKIYDENSKPFKEQGPGLFQETIV